MLQQVDLYGGEVLHRSLYIEGVEPDDTVVVTSISGLDPADVTLFTGDFARDGGYYQGRRLGQRNVVINLKLNADYANDVEVSDIREELYSVFFEPSEEGDAVLMIFKDDRRPDRYLEGYTEKFPAPLFEKDTTAQISLICVDPYFKSALEMSHHDLIGLLQYPVTYSGSAKGGMKLTLRVQTATDRVIVDVQGRQMELWGTFNPDDVVFINSNFGNREVTVNGVDRMSYLKAGSIWPYFRKGENLIKVHGEVENDGDAVLTDLVYREVWWGI